MHDEIATMIAAIKVLLAKFQQDLAALEDRHAAADRDAALPRGHHTALGMTAQDDSGDNTPPPPHP